MADVPAEEVTPLQEQVMKVQRLFNDTPLGRDVLDILRDRFCANLRANDAHQIIFNAGRADVVAWILWATKYNPKGR